ncbi:MAG TPA: hypothetical protein VGI74_19145 [Streptosporangiaceae bacterium]|jgi:adenylosuccinate lyase
MQTTDAQTAADIADLEKLAAELAARGYKTALSTSASRPPHLAVINPRARALNERVIAQAGKFWWPWAEQIAPCDEVAEAAAIIARVLRTTVGAEAGTGQ